MASERVLCPNITAKLLLFHRCEEVPRTNTASLILLITFVCHHHYSDYVWGGEYSGVMYYDKRVD